MSLLNRVEKESKEDLRKMNTEHTQNSDPVKQKKIHKKKIRS